MDARGRGRARGRPRDPAGGQQQQPGPPRPGPGPAAQPQPAWHRPPQPQQMGQPWVRPQAPTPTHSAGRGARDAGGDGNAPPQGAAAVAEEQRRGGGNGTGVRGRNVSYEIIRTRPEGLLTKKGTSGQPIGLMANYFPVLSAGKFMLNQYRVDFNPDLDHTGARKGLLRDALRDVINGYLFDGTVLYTVHRIQPDPMEKTVQDKNGQNYIISIRLVGDVAYGDRQYLQLFNILIRKCFHFLDLKLIGRDYYDPQMKITIPEHGLQIWPGIKCTMKQNESSILLNVEQAFKVMRTESVYDMLMECRGGNVQSEFQQKIIGSIVLTYYNNKTMRIDDVDFSQSAKSTFKKRDGTEISYIDYYKQHYNINIKVPNQPLLISRCKTREIRAGMPETVSLIPELCILTGLTDKQRENFQLMRSLADHTRVAPDKRIENLMKFATRLNNCPEAVEELRRWDLRFANDLVRFQGRVLPMENIFGGNNQKFPAGPEADWTKNLRNCPTFSHGNLKVAVICPEKFNSQVQEFTKTLRNASRGMQLDFGAFKVQTLRDDRTFSYLDCIDKTIQQLDPTLLLCIVPNNSSDRYNAIKKKCCVDRGISSQVVVSRNLTSKGVMSIATKIAIQMNVKVGGAPWSISNPLSQLMVVGYDVCRDTVNKGKCFSAMVASIDKAMTRYYSYVAEHRFDEEISNFLGAFLVLACQRFKEKRGQFPSHILIYRDGVGEGQLPYVIEHEVTNLRKKLIQEIYPDNNLKMAFIIVSKRINTRVFTDRRLNPPPGTVVDDVVTSPERYDFFIVSQCVRQGTVSPTSYNVIFDEMGLNPDKIQIMTYKLCHMYFNWSGTVRVPAPVQYAHKLAFLTAQSLHRQAHRSLEMVLYYL